MLKEEDQSTKRQYLHADTTTTSSTTTTTTTTTTSTNATSTTQKAWEDSAPLILVSARFQFDSVIYCD